MSDFRSTLSDLLAYCGADFQDAADRICERYQDFSLLALTDRFVLSELCGEKYADMIRLLAAVNSRRITDKFKFGVKHTEEEIAQFLLGYYFDSPNERVIAMPLNSKGYILAAETVFDGTVNHSEILPRKVLEIMLRHNSKRVILAHNHPRGSAEASDDDIRTTQNLYHVFSAVSKELVCHYIVSSSEVRKLLPVRSEFEESNA